MNKIRRKKIDKIQDEILELVSKLQDILYEEEDCFENMPENLQGSERGEISQNAIDIMSNTIENIETAANELSDID